jgi:PKD repeat protein
MKKIINRFRLPIFLILIALVLVQSCDKVPTAAFSYEPPIDLVIGDTVYFINDSENASSFEWDFGNGQTSAEESPFVIYEDAAFYTVVLNAISRAGNDTISHVVDINYPTVLGFFVYLPDSVNVLEGCNVWVFDSEEKFQSSDEPDFSEISDEEGVVIFENMEEITYYVSLFKETTEGLYIREGFTNPLEIYSINLYAIVMQFFPGATLKSYQESSLKKSSSKLFSPLKDFGKQEFRF